MIYMSILSVLLILLIHSGHQGKIDRGHRRVQRVVSRCVWFILDAADQENTGNCFPG